MVSPLLPAIVLQHIKTTTVRSYLTLTSLRLPPVHVLLAAGMLALLTGVLAAKAGLVAALGLLVLPGGIFAVGYLLKNPNAGLMGAVLTGFFSSGIARYVDAPWGLALDGFLFIAWLALLFQKFRKTDWSPLRNDIMALALIWYALVVLEVANPESNGLECWFYAMRGNGFYQLLSFGLVFMMYRTVRHLDAFLKWMVALSIIGTLWGLRQMITGVDAAEWKWLYVDGYAFTHMLHGVLRVFSFYSDAGQFGASQAMVFITCAIIALGPVSRKEKILYGIGAGMAFIGFAVSGTRGALAVPAAGALMYLLISKNFKVLALGLLVLGSAFYVLKYTYAFQGIEQVNRMRTAMNPDDASFQVRLRNQVTFGNYLKTRPFGGGIGAAGYWGYRFNPNSLLANTATDSYYVKIWAETGLVGICLHLFMFGWFVGKGGQIVWHLRDPVLRVKIAGLYCGMCGIMLSSYGNQVYSQMPTGIIMGIGIPLIFLSPIFDNQIKQA
jgi:hypothetical protein